MRRAGFTLIELLVTISIIGVLIGVTLPALAGAREQARSTLCGVNLSQIGQAMTMFLSDHKGSLPQVRADFSGNIYPLKPGRPGPEGSGIIGSLFGGKRGTLPIYGIEKLGADRRPLNVYLGDFDPDDEVEIFRDPSDKGTSDPGLAFLQQQLGIRLDTGSMYDLIGTSYNLNDHALDSDPTGELYPTLVPSEGGKMPDVRTPSKTWLVGDQPIYNFDDGGDRGQRWHFSRAQSDLLFVDLHVSIGLPVKSGIENTTRDYTFLPEPGWLKRFAADQ